VGKLYVSSFALIPENGNHVWKATGLLFADPTPGLVRFSYMLYLKGEIT